MDKIVMENLEFYGFHGVLAEERRLGQRFIVSLELFLDLEKAGEYDDLCETVDYSLVYELVENIVIKNKYKLIEALAYNITKEIFIKFNKIKKVLIRIKKPNAPVKGVFKYVSVEFERERNV